MKKISKILSTICLLVSVVGCSQKPPANNANLPSNSGKSASEVVVIPGREAFIGIEMGKLTELQRTNLKQAETDFALVIKGLKPNCKKQPDIAIADGGTLIYNCPQYAITVTKRLTTFQGVNGFLYGPVISFGNDYSVSDVRFYTEDALRTLLSHERSGL